MITKASMPGALAFLASDSKTGYLGAGSIFAECRRSDGGGTHFYRSLVACTPSRQKLS
jgi:hypothetical protein